MSVLRGRGPYLGQAESANKQNSIYMFTNHGNRLPWAHLKVYCPFIHCLSLESCFASAV